MTELPADQMLRCPEISNDELPGHDWGLERLGDFAQRLHTAMVADEVKLAAAYWTLGCALTKARRQLGHGHWLPYLKSLGIDKTRSSKACAIFRTFSTVEEVAELTVDEAYQARPRRSSTPAATDEIEVVAADDATGNLLQLFDEQALQLTTALKSAGHGELQRLLGDVRLVMDRLADFERTVKQALDELERI